MAEKKVTVEQAGMSEDTKSIITVLALLFAYPIGVIVMWFLPKWSRWLKFFLTLPLILIPLLGIFVAVVLVAVNPLAKIQKAQEIQCVKTCAKYDASNSACIGECRNSYKTGKFRNYYISPAPTVYPTY